MHGVAIPIFYEDYVLGQVRLDTTGAPSFQYEEAWRATTGAFPISVTMPLSADIYPEEVIAPWLANLLPEEQQLVALSRSLGINASDTIAILTEIGGDTAGALSFAEPSVREQWAYKHLATFYNFDQDTALARHIDDLARRPFLAGEDGIRLSLAGGQKKTTLALLDAAGRPMTSFPGKGQEGFTFAIPMHGAPSNVIIKPDNPVLPGIVENEAYCLAMANCIGIAAAEATILPIGSRSGLMVQRFDRIARSDGSIRRLHQIDFAQANGFSPIQKYERGTIAGPNLTTILRTADHLPPRDALDLADQVIFNILVGNTDAHAKNYSMLLSGVPRLAPLYDVSSVLPWEHVNQYHAQNIAGRKRRPGNIAGRHWNRIAQESGQSPRGMRLRVEEIVDAMVAAREGVTEAIGVQSGAVQQHVDHVADLIEQNALRVMGRLGE